MWQIVLVVCGFITLWVLMIVYGWIKLAKAVDKKNDELSAKRIEHKLKMEEMRKKHESMERDFDKSWGKLGK